MVVLYHSPPQGYALSIFVVDLVGLVQPREEESTTRSPCQTIIRRACVAVTEFNQHGPRQTADPQRVAGIAAEWDTIC